MWNLIDALIKDYYPDLNLNKDRNLLIIDLAYIIILLTMSWYTKAGPLLIFSNTSMLNFFSQLSSFFIVSKQSQLTVHSLTDAPHSTPGYRCVWPHLASIRSKIMLNNLVRRSKGAYYWKLFLFTVKTPVLGTLNSAISNFKPDLTELWWKY